MPEARLKRTRYSYDPWTRYEWRSSLCGRLNMVTSLEEIQDHEADCELCQDRKKLTEPLHAEH
jgi:hypothetical protein